MKDYGKRVEGKGEREPGNGEQKLRLNSSTQDLAALLRLPHINLLFVCLSISGVRGKGD